jgi:nucleotide-binding universal stress UspA family protein
MRTILEDGEPPIIASVAASVTTQPRIDIRNILVPLDFSRGSMQALRYAIPLANQLKAQLHLLHVSSPDEAATVVDAGHVMRECAEAVAFTQEKLGIVPRGHVPAFWPQNCHVREGNPHNVICRSACEIQADLIVLATRGNHGLRRIALGSTAERVVRFAPCPVLIVRQRRRKNSGLPNVVTARHRFRIRRMLVPVDFSRCGIRAARYAALLAKRFSAKLRFLHVVPPPIPLVVRGVVVSAGSNEGEVKRARRRMEKLAKQDFLAGLKCETAVETGDVVETICDVSRGPEFDLVVTSTHGRSGFNRWLLGSVAERLVRYVNGPILVVPSRRSAVGK